LDGGLANGILVSQRVAVTWLRAEVLRHQDGDAGDPLILLPRRLHDTPPRRVGVAEAADHQVDLAASKRLIPAFRIVRSVIEELTGPRGHPRPKRLREALQRVLRHT